MMYRNPTYEIIYEPLRPIAVIQGILLSSTRHLVTWDSNGSDLPASHFRRNNNATGRALQKGILRRATDSLGIKRET